MWKTVEERSQWLREDAGDGDRLNAPRHLGQNPASWRVGQTRHVSDEGAYGEEQAYHTPQSACPGMLTCPRAGMFARMEGR
jgi:hypothetical protein